MSFIATHFDGSRILLFTCLHFELAKVQGVQATSEWAPRGVGCHSTEVHESLPGADASDDVRAQRRVLQGYGGGVEEEDHRHMPCCTDG